MVKPQNIVSLSEFQRDAAGFVKRLKKSGDPYVLTVRGKAAICIMDASRFEHLVREVQRQQDLEAIREGLEQADAGQVRPWEDVRRDLDRRARARRAAARRVRKAG